MENTAIRVDEVRAAADRCSRAIKNALAKFVEETGLEPQVEFRNYDVSRYGEPSFMRQVVVKVELYGAKDG